MKVILTIPTIAYHCKIQEVTTLFSSIFKNDYFYLSLTYLHLFSNPMNLFTAINKIVYKKLSLIIIYNRQLFLKLGLQWMLDWQTLYQVPQGVCCWSRIVVWQPNLQTSAQTHNKRFLLKFCAFQDVYGHFNIPIQINNLLRNHGGKKVCRHKICRHKNFRGSI